MGAEASFGEADFEGDGFDEADGMYQEVARDAAPEVTADDFVEQPWLDEADASDVEDPEGYLEVDGEDAGASACLSSCYSKLY